MKNLLSAENASFEGGTVGDWGANTYQCTLSNSTVQASAGVRSLAMTKTGASGDMYCRIPSNSPAAPSVVGGNEYQVSVDYYPTGTVTAVQARWQWFDAANNIIGGSTTTQVPAPPNQWTTVTNVAVAPTNAAKVQIFLYVVGPGAAGATTYVDNIVFGPTVGAPGDYPVPSGRGRWRLTLHNRTFARPPATWQSTIITELPTAYSRKLVQAWSSAATLSFNLDGWSPAAALVQELQHDIIAWRWDDTRGVDEPLFRGVVGQSEDNLDEQSHTVTFTAHDYFEMLNRRFLTTPQSWTTDQDDIANNLLAYGSYNAVSGSGGSFAPGSNTPLIAVSVNPDGSSRAWATGTPTRVRNYLPQQNIGTALDELSKVQGGFDYDVVPSWRFSPGGDNASDSFRIFYPRQGVTNPLVLNYPGLVATVKRQVDSANYANYERVLGNNQSSLASTAQLASEAWTTDSYGVTVGLWMDNENASDVVDQATLDDRRNGYLNTMAVLQPLYSLTLRAGAYYSGLFYMGDTVTLVVQSGRLNVNTQVRIMGIEYDIGDDGDENIVLTVGRPDTTLLDMMAATSSDVEALARR